MKRKILSIPLWIQWMLATSLSIPLGWSLWGLLFFLPLLNSRFAILFLWLAIGAMIFVPLGVSQWAILRRRIRHAIWWIPATAIGSLLGLFSAVWSLFVLGTHSPSPDLFFFVGAFVGGIVLGFLQWLVLNPSCQKAYWWILASGVGWMGSVSWFALYSTRFFVEGSHPGEMVGWLLLAGASGGVGGMVKGIALAWILAIPHK